VDVQPEPDEAAAADLAIKAVADGGCVLVLRNTVGRAQGAYAQLKGTLDPAQVMLAHARFTAADRRFRDQQLIMRFGAPPAAVRPERHVVVATQVAEQSLDIDFDLLISDLAPIDLLLQRLGRVHRHDRPRPPHIGNPRLVIVGHEPQPDAPPGVPPGSVWVYGRYLLWRTAATLLGVRALHLPADIPHLVEEVYGDAPVGPPGWQAALREASAEHLAKRARHQAAAEPIVLPDLVRPGCGRSGAGTKASLWKRATHKSSPR
jgi:CRISPR/Cas system-associated endonuclease/helicase Cas3